MGYFDVLYHHTGPQNMCPLFYHITIFQHRTKLAWSFEPTRSTEVETAGRRDFFFLCCVVLKQSHDLISVIRVSYYFAHKEVFSICSASVQHLHSCCRKRWTLSSCLWKSDFWTTCCDFFSRCKIAMKGLDVVWWKLIEISALLIQRHQHTYLLKKDFQSRLQHWGFIFTNNKVIPADILHFLSTQTAQSSGSCAQTSLWHFLPT